MRSVRPGDTDGVIGVWASASRPKVTVLKKKGKSPVTSRKWVQVSRLGNTLVNELLMPFEAKDLFNATKPKDDEENIRDFIVNPGDSQSPFAIVPLLDSVSKLIPRWFLIHAENRTILQPHRVASLKDHPCPRRPRRSPPYRTSCVSSTVRAAGMSCLTRPDRCIGQVAGLKLGSLDVLILVWLQATRRV